MLSSLLLLASSLQDPLYPCQRFEPFGGPTGMADFNQDGLDDLYGRTNVLLSDGSFGGKVLDIPSGNGDPRVVELNGDGYPDLAQPEFLQGVSVMIFDPATETFDVSEWEEVFDLQHLVAGGDVDGDGNMDLFAGANDYFVQLGDGAGGTLGHVAGELGLPLLDAALGDLNGDGLSDLVASYDGPGGLIVALATGGGALAAPSTLPGKHFALGLSDLDADGDLDVVTATTADARTYLGDGSGALVLGDAVPIPPSFLAFQLHVVDFDSSGTLDAVLGDQFDQTHELLVAYGDGQGGFAGSEVLELASPQHGFGVGDPDGDGDVEVAVFTFHDASPEDQYSVSFYERDGDGGFVAPVLLADLPAKLGYDSMLVGDADEDGDHDLLVVHGSFTSQAKLDIGRNDGAGELDFQAGPPLLPLVGRVALADVAGDGTTDLLGFPSTGINMTLNPGDGGGTFGPSILLPLEGKVLKAALADWSGDGLVDIVSPVGAKLYLYGGQPTYSFAAPLIKSLTGGSPLDIAPGDIDLDGELDVMGLSTTRLIPVLGDGTGGFTELPFITLTPLAGTANGLDLGDFDIDGLPDVVLNDGSWYRSLGAGQFDFAGQPYQPVYPPATTVAGDVHVSDLDGDGFDDAVVDDGAVLLGGPLGLQLDRAYYSTGTLSVAVGNLTMNGPRDLVAQHAQMGYVLLPSLGGCLGEFVPYGAGCMGSGGVVPALSGSGCPTPAGSWALDVTGGLPSTVAFASFGLGQGSIPLPNGCTLLLDPWLQIFIGFTLDAAGEGSLPIAVSPDSPMGFTVTSQVGLFDPGAPGFFTLTNGLSVSVR